MNPDSRDSPFNHSSKKAAPGEAIRVKPFIPPMGYNSRADSSIEVNNKPQTLRQTRGKFTRGSRILVSGMAAATSNDNESDLSRPHISHVPNTEFTEMPLQSSGLPYLNSRQPPEKLMTHGLEGPGSKKTITAGLKAKKPSHLVNHQQMQYINLENGTPKENRNYNIVYNTNIYNYNMITGSGKSTFTKKKL